MDIDLKEFLIKQLKSQYEGGFKFENNCIVIKNASKPNAPIHPEDIMNILKQAARKFKLGQYDLAYSINEDGFILVSKSLN